jgi:riboflavin kinase/FMN adenylyltransferase
VGTRPTFGGGAAVLEVHLLDGGEELYGRELTVQFVAWVREDRRFESERALVRQIEQDLERIRGILAVQGPEEA